ncbi:cellobiohydrolaseI [Guyanagaster necrorhizus]|uniref:Glucanase n=1 Tax=Guyanagaster necrorhizus TaxID=856835 RepID=A0A9P7VJR0_9AGAR|nr:cellobiohydrolaseI [Guyanagaster necrorhizus MCA 3950]KAG7441209.1 cellobiohydrolaseI [Guyanagaster necrorhizus MCA 3950]
MYSAAAIFAFALLRSVRGQQIGTYTAEDHPVLTVQQCSAGGSCTTQSKSVVLDSNWRWLHSTTGYTNCYTGNQWDATLCPDVDTCTANCALDGADYSGTYGISTSGNALTLNFVTHGANTNVGSRVYLLDDENTYHLFNMKNQEFTFDVDVSNLPCGLNGALYFVQMDGDGGKARFPTNAAGAAYGTGYCDTQCPQDLKFIDGQANMLNWTGTSANSGTGFYGTCCNEMDVWEANSLSAAFTPHVCSGITGQTRCSGTACGEGDERYDGVCDKDGCDFNSWRMGDETFYGPSMTVDTTSKFSVVTQFLTSDNTTTGDLVEIRRIYVQNGQVIQNSATDFPGIAAYNSITDDFCNAQKTLFGDTNSFETRGGLAEMGDAFEAGMVLVMSIWDDYAVNMLWLDSDYPTDGDPCQPGISRGPCATTSGVPATVEAESGISVVYSNIKFGPIGSTFA